MLRHACGYKLANEGQDTRAFLTAFDAVPAKFVRWIHRPSPLVAVPPFSRFVAGYAGLVVTSGNVLHQIDNAAPEFWILDAHEVFRE
jgi:hypothetical protein